MTEIPATPTAEEIKKVHEWERWHKDENDKTNVQQEREQTQAVRVPKRASGAIIYVYHDNERVLQHLARELEDMGFNNIEAFKGRKQDQKQYFMCHVRSGNLDLEGWLHAFSGDLEDMRTDGMIPDLGDSLVVSIELLYGGD